jgi:hypothetical protein
MSFLLPQAAVISPATSAVISLATASDISMPIICHFPFHSSCLFLYCPIVIDWFFYIPSLHPYPLNREERLLESSRPLNLGFL